ncbi:MAG: endolytic transglycosylase MltG [Gaiellaceae bacterium]
MRRRAGALLVFAAVTAVAVWLVSLALGEIREADEAAPEPATSAAQPPLDPLRIVFPEGFTRAEMAARITAVNEIAKSERGVTPKLSPRRYLALTRRHSLPGEFAGDDRPRQLEGFLFPATYDFLPGTTTKKLVEDQLVAFQRAWAEVDLTYAKSKNLTAYDVLIIASMIEKETVVPRERRLVASVIYNRLRAGMALGIDATIRYGLEVPGNEPLRQSQLTSDNPYNTRNRLGLPPTPIANPGLSSIRAAALPVETDYLYFVRKPDERSHFFTASESEFFRKACGYGYGCG